MGIRSTAYKISLPGVALSDEDLHKLAQWSCDSCCRAVVTRIRPSAVWVAERKKMRSKSEWLRHIRGVVSALALDTRLLSGETWLALC